MAIALNNNATLNGQYDNVTFNPQSANIMVQIVDMSVALAAISTVWIGRELTYNVIIAHNDTALPLTNLVLTDILNPVLTTFVTGSVAIGGIPVLPADVTYDTTSGLLTVQVPNVPANETSNITFRVAKK